MNVRQWWHEFWAPFSTKPPVADNVPRDNEQIAAHWHRYITPPGEREQLEQNAEQIKQELEEAQRAILGLMRDNPKQESIIPGLELYIMIDHGRLVGRDGEPVLVWPETGDDAIMIQRWLLDGRRLDLITQLTNWRMTISAAGNALTYEDAY